MNEKDASAMNEPTAPAFPVMSDDALIANLAVFASEWLRRATHALVHTGAVDLVETRVPLPLSRAEGADYTRIVELWNEYRATRPINAPARPCPACRSTNSRFEFISYDRYPFHTCTACGTWFVPMVIDDHVIEEFFDAVPEARQRSDKMMAERNERTREGDRERFGRYFEMLSPFVSQLTRAPRYLDLGCGVGHSVELAAAHGWPALGIEVNEVAVSTARASGRNVVPPGEAPVGHQFDVISLFETLEHITNPDDVMAGLINRLAPGGVVMITVPHRASFELSLLRNRSFHVFGGFENVGHINLFDAIGLEAFFERHGLTTLFLDGEFSSDLTQLLAFLSDRRASGPLSLEGDHLTLSLAPAAHDLVNAMGPAFAAFERALKRSPILIAVACRPGDAAALAGFKEALEANWRASLDAMIAAGERSMQAHQSSFRTLLADLQTEVTRRDEMLQRLQAEANDLQQLLHETHEKEVATQKRFARTIEGRLGRFVRRVILGRPE